MRTASAGLVSFLNSTTQFYVADLLTIVLAGGTTLRLTSADVDIVANGNTYLARGTGAPPFVRSNTRMVAGLEVDSLQLAIYPDPAVHTLVGLLWPAAVARGALDEARVTLERAYMPTFGDVTAGTINLFSGRVGKVSPSRTEIQIDVVADLELLRAPMPRNTYQPGCVHTLFDTGCALSKATFATASTVGVGSTASSLLSAIAAAAGYFDLGTVTFTSGALVGLSRTVRSYASGAFSFALPLPSAPAPGDAFTAYAGCDKLQATCSSKFANLARFRGYPYIPTPENAR